MTSQSAPARAARQLSVVFAALALFVSLFMLHATVARAQDAPGAPDSLDGINSGAANSPDWHRQTIFSGSAAAQGTTSLAVRASDGMNFVSYYDATNKELKLAMPVPPGTGNCGSYSAWRCSTVDSAGDAGRVHAIALSPGTNLPVIAYVVNAEVLKFAQASACSAGTCTWTIVTVDDALNHEFTDVALVVDPNNTAHVAYVRFNTGGDGDDQLHYARTVGSGGNCGNSGWQCDTIDDTARGIIDLEMDVATAAGNSFRPRIAYSRYDKAGNDIGPSFLMYAAYSVQGGDCGPAAAVGQAWTCHKLLTFPGYNPLTVGLRMDGSEPHIAYERFDNASLNYITLDFQDLTGNCGPSNQYHCTQVETVGTAPTLAGDVAITLAGGVPQIAFISTREGGNGALRAAHRRTTNTPGSCVNIGAPTANWDCAMVDDGQRTGATHDMGGGLGFAFWDGLGGALRITYLDTDLNDLLLAQDRTFTPILSGLNPASAPAGSADTAAALSGAYFDPNAQVVVDGFYAITDYVDASHVTLTLVSAALQSPGVKQVKVCNPPLPQGDCSAALPFTVTDGPAEVYLPLVGK